jgi:predicted ribosomally synthesized peptide with SipW-like signal peptide
MSRKITWLILALLAVGVMTGSTSTYMSDSASNAENYFKVGSLAISLDPTSAAFGVPAMSPGQVVEAPLAVKNEGSVGCTFTIAAHKTAGYSALYDVLTCKVTDGNGAILFDGPLASLASGAAQLGAGQTDAVKIAVGLPADIGNDLAAKYCKVSFDVAAEQPH